MSIGIVQKASVLLEALPYIQRFRGSVFVVKYGGAFMDDPNPAMRQSVAQDLVFLAAVGIHVVVVHGGGKAITRALDASGLKTEFRQGLRVTDAEAVKVVERVLNNETNREIGDLIRAQGGRPLALTGNSVFVCHKLTTDDAGQPLDLGFVGDITVVKSKLIKKAYDEGHMPVISPIALDESGQPYNTNADTAASHVAASLRARRLVYLCDVPGLLRDPKDPASLISTLHVDDVQPLVDRGVISSGMVPKVQSAVKALRQGVHRVHFVDGRMPHSLLLEIFTDKGIGTEIVSLPQAVK